MAFIKKIFWEILGGIFDLLCRLFEEDEEDEGWSSIEPEPVHLCIYCGEKVYGADPETELVLCESCQAAIAEPGD